MKHLFVISTSIVSVIVVFGITSTAAAQERLITAPDTPRVYAVADNGSKRWLSSPQILQSYDHDFGQVETISSALLNRIPRTKAIRLEDQPGVYVLTDADIKQGVASRDALRAAGLSLRDVVSINKTEFESYESGPFITASTVPPTPAIEANLITGSDSPRVYAIGPNGTKRWLRTPSVLRSYGFTFPEVATVAPPKLTSYPRTKAIRLEGQPGVYRLNPDWTKQGIARPEVMRSLGLTMGDVVVVNETEFTSYPTGPFLAHPSASDGAYELSRTYRSTPLDFAIDYPEEMVANRTQMDTVRLQLFGPTQPENTEFTDGVSITIRREALDSTPLQEYAHETAVNQPLVDTILEPVTRVNMNGIAGYSATVRTLGDVTHIFLPSVVNSTFHISYVNPDPGNRGYQELVDNMLATFRRL